VYAPRTLAQLSRAELCARIQTLGNAIDLLWSLTDAQRAEPYGVTGRCKIELVALETALRQRGAQ
jgi:hypothetical protein